MRRRTRVSEVVVVARPRGGSRSPLRRRLARRRLCRREHLAERRLRCPAQAQEHHEQTPPGGARSARGDAECPHLGRPPFLTEPSRSTFSAAVPGALFRALSRASHLNGSDGIGRSAGTPVSTAAL